MESFFSRPMPQPMLSANALIRNVDIVCPQWPHIQQSQQHFVNSLSTAFSMLDTRVNRGLLSGRHLLPSTQIYNRHCHRCPRSCDLFGRTTIFQRKRPHSTIKPYGLNGSDPLSTHSLRHQSPIWPIVPRIKEITIITNTKIGKHNNDAPERPFWAKQRTD